MDSKKNKKRKNKSKALNSKTSPSSSKMAKLSISKESKNLPAGNSSILPEVDEETEDAFNFGEDLFEVPEFEPLVPPLTIFEKGSIKYRKFDKRSILVHLALNSSLTLTGRCWIKVLKGTVDICGYRMTNDDPKEKMFSPTGQSLIPIRCIALRPPCKSSDLEELSSLISKEEVEGEEGASFIMEGFDDGWTDTVRKYSGSLIGKRTTGIGPSVTVKPMYLMGTLGFKFFKENGTKFREKYKKIEIDQKWDSIFDNLHENGVRLALFGGKRIGKSTMNRWIVNRYLSRHLVPRVLFIDLDLGQPEFTPPGIVSITLCTKPLLGPSFTHITTPLHSEFLGVIAVNEIPQTYLDAIKNLKDYLMNAKEFHDIPWIFNTMGFCQGLGVHFACEIIKIMELTDVVQLNSQDPKNNFPFNLSFTNVVKNNSRFLGSSLSCHKYSFTKVDTLESGSYGKANSGMNPKDSRDLLFTSYFAPIISSTQLGILYSVIPFYISLKFVGISSLSEGPSYKGILQAIDGNLVGLFNVPTDALSPNSQDSNENFLDCLKFKFLNDSTQRFIGFGIVRNVDLEEKTLYLLTPLSQQVLAEEVNGLVTAGRIGLPIQFLIQGSQPNREIPYVHDFRQSGSKLHTATTRTYIPTKAHI